MRGGVVGGRFDEAVDEEFGLVDCLVGGGLVIEAREDEGDEGRGIGRGRGRVFGQDGGVVGYACAGRLSAVVGDTCRGGTY